MRDDARQAPQEVSAAKGEPATSTGSVKRSASRPSGRPIVTPQGTMVVVLLYALSTVLLWSYVYYYTLRFGGVIDGH